MTRELTLSPAERYDVVITNNEPKNAKYTITNESDSGFEFPLNYAYNKSLSTPEFNQHTAVKELTFDVANNAKPDIEVRMDSSMKMGEGHQWTINGEVFPDAEEFFLNKDELYVIRFYNDSRMFNHSMHIHGSHFKVMNINGIETDSLIWKDTIDVAIQFENAGAWMMHCHILDHEDGG